MNASQRLARELEKACFGAAWHGASWSEVMSGLSADAAGARPVPNAHSIAEIVAHASTWFDVVNRRLNGETPQVPSELDWPRVTELTEGDWKQLAERSLLRARALVDTVQSLSPERLLETRPGLEETWFELVSGELQHVLYHAGQVGLLKKAAG